MKIKEMFFHGFYDVKGERTIGTHKIKAKWKFIDLIKHECRLEDMEITHVSVAPRGEGFDHWIKTYGLDSYAVRTDTEDSTLVLAWIKKG